MTAPKPELTAGQVAVLVLYADGNSYREAGAILGISESAAKSRCARAAEALGTHHVTHTYAEAKRRGLFNEESTVPRQDQLADDLTLEGHARRELAILGEDQDVIDGIASVVQAFASCGHSGGSAPYAIAYLEKLLRFQALTPLTDNPDEWIDRTEISGTPMWQSARDPRAISLDGGKTYQLTDEMQASGSPEVTPVHVAAPWKGPAR